MGNKYDKWIKLFFSILLISGILMIFNQPIRDYVVKKNTENLTVKHFSAGDIKKNQELTEKEAAKKSSDIVSFDIEAVKPISTSSTLHAMANRKKYPVVAGIAIPSVEINLPIFIGLANDALHFGVGTLTNGQVMGKGNYALAGHRAENPAALFSPLEHLQMGSDIYLTDLQNVYIYKTILKKKVAPTETYLLDEVAGQTVVTLITCGESEGITRIVVQGQLEQVIPVRELTKEMEQAFEI